MLIQQLRDVLHAMFIGSLLLALCHNAFAQNQSQPAGKTAVKKSKANADSCDGALDIVPVKSMTFTRKRRPFKSEAKPEAKPEAKLEAKPEAKPEPKPEAKPEQLNPPNSTDAKDASRKSINRMKASIRVHSWLKFFS